MDVKIVFLNKNLQEDMYVIKSESFKYKKFANKLGKI
jgi:hypothetical protein